MVNSTNITLQNMTLDLDLVKANFVHGLLFCDATGTVHNNIIQNLSMPDTGTGGYLEIGGDYRAPSYSAASPAAITISDNTFIDTGRLGVVTHEFVDATITGNTFYKTTDDFGYAIEIGGPSTATITGNVIYGFDTAALSDGSESAGIYIENCFTTGMSGITKDVLVENNEVYDSQYAMWIGNGYNAYAGDVDIAVTLNNNNFHDNVDGGVWVQDEDMADGSSVSVSGGGNTLTNNGDHGYYIYTGGDGDVTVDLSGETITGHGVGVFAEDTGSPSTSAYSVSIDSSSIAGNTYGINNTVAGLVIDADENWWGCPCGPAGEGPGSGDPVSTNVTYSPWYADAGMTTTVSEGAGGELMVPAGTDPAEIQAIMDCAGGSTVVFEGDSYTGGITVTQPGTTINLGGATFGPGSPAFIIAAANVTINGPGSLNGDPTATGTNSTDPAVLIQTDADNFTLNSVYVLNWEDGIEVEGDVTSLKVVSNFIHDNTDAGLQVNSTVVIDGVVTIEGNLFKDNGAGIRNDGANSLTAQYNSWGAATAPSAGDFPGTTAVDATNHTFAELFMDMDPDSQAVQRNVVESETFEVKLKVDAVELRALEFKVAYDTDFLVLNSATWSPAFDNATRRDLGTGVGVEHHTCVLSDTLTSGVQDVLTLNFTATDTDGSHDGEAGPWSQYFDVSHTETSAGAVGGVKIFVNNAGFNDPSVAARDITSGQEAGNNDGEVIITGIAQFTGFVDLQGRPNDSGATISVYDQQVKTGSTLLAEATSAAGGDYLTAYVSPNLLAIGETYWLEVDAKYYLPTTVHLDGNYLHSKLLDTRPETLLALVKLLGGDATDDELIDILDLSLIGGQYGSPTFPEAADVNADGQVDILDLVLAGGNYALTSSPWAP